MKMDIELQGKFIQIFDFFNIYYRIHNNLNIMYDQGAGARIIEWFLTFGKEDSAIATLRSRLDYHAQGLLLYLLTSAYNEDVAHIINNLSTNHSDFYSDMVEATQKHNLHINLSEDVLRIGKTAMDGFNHRM